MRAHSAEFRREVIQVTNGVWVAVGFSDANSVLIEGEGGSIVVDTTSDVEDARAVKAEFAKLSTAPVRAIIYTHSHPDHTGGGGVFAGKTIPRNPRSPTFCGARPGRGPQRARRRRSVRLHPAGRAVHQCRHGAGVRATPCPTAYVAPTRTFSEDRLELTIAGVRLQLLHTPGETRENVAVWLPDRRVLLPGDDFYKAFPTLYAIRGARLRPIDQWIASLGLMIDLGADYLVPGHTRPVLGSANVRAALTTYRDGIKSVVDQTLEGMKKGERPDELVQHVALPPALADNPYLQEFYGTVAWSVRAIYADYAGWFDGNPAKLFPLAEGERRPESSSWPAVANRCCRGRDAPWPARTSNGRRSWPTTCWQSITARSRRSGSKRRRSANSASGRSARSRGTITCPPPSICCATCPPAEAGLKSHRPADSTTFTGPVSPVTTNGPNVPRTCFRCASSQSDAWTK